ncbi:acyl-CoA dehydrogenase [Microbacterium resistens]|uniref:Acyl-CoA dehydrogenase n=1 Tax=Microbacterium resistens TaxID=156977 RepID=A0ABU1SAI2_9MICO|nr:acyl-CoA dehydrogenase family protein [Microbacterium resistens]MDR6866610.1 acyl-CoA dehydrogenase [Microbacterium resistens]
MTTAPLNEALAAIASGSGDIADALDRAARLISGADPQRRGTVVLNDEILAGDSQATAAIPIVLGADAADYLVIIGAAAVVIVDLDAEGVVREPIEDLGGVGGAGLTLTHAPVRVVDTSSELAEYQLRVLAAAALIRNAHEAYRLARDYVREREQFGAPLLRIPGVAANLARVHVEIQRLEAALARGVRSGASSVDALVLSGVAADAATRVARLAHQLSGAQGIREDYALQVHTRRIWAARDFPRGEHVDTERLGRIARRGGESEVWELLTSAG